MEDHAAGSSQEGGGCPPQVRRSAGPCCACSQIPKEDEVGKCAGQKTDSLRRSMVAVPIWTGAIARIQKIRRAGAAASGSQIEEEGRVADSCYLLSDGCSRPTMLAARAAILLATEGPRSAFSSGQSRCQRPARGPARRAQTVSRRHHAATAGCRGCWLPLPVLQGWGPGGKRVCEGRGRGMYACVCSSDDAVAVRGRRLRPLRRHRRQGAPASRCTAPRCTPGCVEGRGRLRRVGEPHQWGWRAAQSRQRASRPR